MLLDIKQLVLTILELALNVWLQLRHKNLCLCSLRMVFSLEALGNLILDILVPFFIIALFSFLQPHIGHISGEVYVRLASTTVVSTPLILIVLTQFS